MYYQLKNGDLYLEEIDYEENTINKIIFNKEMGIALKDFELADEIRKVVFIELGVELRIEKVKLFNKEDN